MAGLGLALDLVAVDGPVAVREAERRVPSSASATNCFGAR